jgi:hypothetical protein
MEDLETAQSFIGEALEGVQETLVSLAAAATILQRDASLSQEVARIMEVLHAVDHAVTVLLIVLEAEEALEEKESLSEDRPEQQSCVLCHQQLKPSDRILRTAGEGEDGLAHLACAELHAAEATARDRRWALVSGIIFVGVILTAWVVLKTTLWLLVLVIAGIVLHVVLHRRWWYYARRDLARWMVLGGRS